MLIRERKRRRNNSLKELVESQGKLREIVKNSTEDRGSDSTKKIKLQRAYRRMPWYMAPKKDVTSCEKLRGTANRYRSVDVRMRKLTVSNVTVSLNE